MIDLYYFMIMALCLFWIWGINYAFKPGEILGQPGDWIRNNWPSWLVTPLFDCPYCMSSIHGTVFFWFFLSDYEWYLWPVFVVSLTGIGALVRPD